MRETEIVTPMRDMRNARKMLARKLHRGRNGKDHFGIPRCGLRVILKEVGCEAVDYINPLSIGSSGGLLQIR